MKLRNIGIQMRELRTVRGANSNSYFGIYFPNQTKGGSEIKNGNVPALLPGQEMCYFRPLSF